MPTLRLKVSRGGRLAEKQLEHDERLCSVVSGIPFNITFKPITDLGLVETQ